MRKRGIVEVIRSLGPFVLIVFVLPLFFLGTLVAVLPFFDYQKFQETSENGVETTADIRILRKADIGYTCEISWADRGGLRRTVQMALSESYLRNHAAHLKGGIKIKYLVNDNSSSPVVMGDEKQTLSIIKSMPQFGIKLIVASLISGVFGFLLLWTLRLPTKWLLKSISEQISKLHNQRHARYAHKFVEQLPFETVIVPGCEAFATWTRLKAEGHGYPVVLGTEQEAAGLLQTHTLDRQARMAAAAEIQEKAQNLRHPIDLQKKWQADAMLAHEAIKKIASAKPRFPVLKIFSMSASDSENKQSDEEARAWLLREPEEDQAPLGEWPEQIAASPNLSIIEEFVSNERNGQQQYSIKIKDRVVVALLPVSRSSEVLSYLLYGNWNACPPPEYHLAAQRSWSERYGAEIVGINFDTLNIRVACKPEIREEALNLAREHYVYCNDIIDQGFGTLSNLAAQLMQDEWWFFWWD